MSDEDGSNVVHVSSYRLAASVRQLERYGPPSPDILDVLEALDRFNDDRANGRAVAQSRGALVMAAEALESE